MVCITNIGWKKWRHEKRVKTQNHEVYCGAQVTKLGTLKKRQKRRRLLDGS